MSWARWHVGNALDVLRTMDDGSVDEVLTSPPYFLQREYLLRDDPDKAHEIGREHQPGLFLAALLEVMDEVWRVLSDDGTFWVNLGDTHAGSGGTGGDFRGGERREGQPRSPGTAGKRGRLKDRAADEDLGITQKRLRTRRTLDGYPLDQSVCWLPYLFGASLAYGANILTGEPCSQWVTRPPITWCKPSVTPGADGRKFRTATETIVYGGKHQQHYWDIDPVRINSDPDDNEARVSGIRDEHRETETVNGRKVIKQNPLGRPPYNWWVVNTQPYPGAHYATFPPELCVKPIIVGCPPGGTVLDPFAGTGTVLAVATGHGRNAIGIDLDKRNVELARHRVGMFLEEARTG